MLNYNGFTSSLTVECEGPVRIISLNRPDFRNAINQELHDAILEAFLLIGADPDARSVLLRANGDIFTAGGDYEWFQELQQDPVALERSVEDGRRLLKTLIDLPLPLVTAIQGGAVGLGASLGLLSDIVVMSEDAFYRDTHVKLGMTAGDGGLAWAGSTSLQVAKEYVLLGDRLSAQEAHRLGIANRVVPRDQLEVTSRTYADRLAALPARSTRATKRGFNMILETIAGGAFEFALASELSCLLSSEHRTTVDGLAAGSGSRLEHP